MAQTKRGRKEKGLGSKAQIKADKKYRKEQNAKAKANRDRSQETTDA